jgi:cell division protein FtsQ
MLSRRNKRRKSKKKPINAAPLLRMPQIKWMILLNICALLGVSGLAYTGVLWVLAQPVESVRVEGTFERVSAVQVEAALSPYLEQGFLSLDLADVQAAVTALPWVAHASVRRSWPAALSVTLVEQRAAARWGKDGLLNVYGELFVANASHIPAELPLLDGPPGTELRVAQHYFDLDAQLQQRGLSAAALELDARGSWELTLSNGIVVRLGTENIDARAARFFTALDRVLQPLAEQINYVDMRYTNGFAVGWKAEANVATSGAEVTAPNA